MRWMIVSELSCFFTLLPSISLFHTKKFVAFLTYFIENLLYYNINFCTEKKKWSLVLCVWKIWPSESSLVDWHALLYFIAVVLILGWKGKELVLTADIDFKTGTRGFCRKSVWDLWIFPLEIWQVHRGRNSWVWWTGFFVYSWRLRTKDILLQKNLKTNEDCAY